MNDQYLKNVTDSRKTTLMDDVTPRTRQHIEAPKKLVQLLFLKFVIEHSQKDLEQ